MLHGWPRGSVAQLGQRRPECLNTAVQCFALVVKAECVVCASPRSAAVSRCLFPVHPDGAVDLKQGSVGVLRTTHAVRQLRALGGLRRCASNNHNVPLLFADWRYSVLPHQLSSNLTDG
jgi:hypothetical protein